MPSTATRFSHQPGGMLPTRMRTGPEKFLSSKLPSGAAYAIAGELGCEVGVGGYRLDRDVGDPLSRCCAVHTDPAAQE